MIAQLLAPGGGLVAEVECAPGSSQIVYGNRVFTLINGSYIEFVPMPQAVVAQTPGFIGLRSEDPSFPLNPGLRLPASGF